MGAGLRPRRRRQLVDLLERELVPARVAQDQPLAPVPRRPRRARAVRAPDGRPARAARGRTRPDLGRRSCRERSGAAAGGSSAMGTGIPVPTDSDAARSTARWRLSGRHLSSDAEPGVPGADRAAAHTSVVYDDAVEQPSGPVLRADEVSWAGDTLERLSEAFGGKVVGQGRLQETLLIGLLTGGHILLESVPGLAKTTAASTLAHAVSGSFSRIQCTPDLLPSDIVGTQVYDASTAGFTTHLGPVHANIVLLDEINRASAKTQSAMLEAMQERQTSIGGQAYPLPGAVPRPRHPEPHRAGGHLRPARGAARPVHAQGRPRLPDPRGGGRGPVPDRRRRLPRGPEAGRRHRRRARGCRS